MPDTHLMRYHRHLSDLRTGLLLRGASLNTDEAVLQMADTCAKALAEARRLVASDSRSPVLTQLLARSRNLLDELDVALLALSHDRDRPVFQQLAVLRDTLIELDTAALRLDAPRLVKARDPGMR